MHLPDLGASPGAAAVTVTATSIINITGVAISEVLIIIEVVLC